MSRTTNFIFLILLSTTTFGQEIDSVTTKADLNGDGIADKITLTITENKAMNYDADYVLSINNINIKGFAEILVHSLNIVDIDSKDKFKETIQPLITIASNNGFEFMR